jgi:hypothetical protein
MTAQTNSTLDKVALVQAASESGRLADYVPAKSWNSAGTKMPMSWGPAMRSS